MKTHGYFGGTFDPIHNGHLSVATQLVESLGLDMLWFLPAGDPWQRQPTANKEDRLNMVKLALNTYPLLNVDEREVHRHGPTYTIDSVKEIRHEHGLEAPLWFIIGADSFLNLTTWRDWQHLLDYVHIAIACRPNYDLKKEQLPPGLRSILDSKLEDDPKLISTPSGKVSIISITESPISATQVRECIRQHEDIRSLVPLSVNHYIHQHHLYQ
ncbi:MAG: nicotinate-nucleotide adenylyltransferase [Betaproteobacteria bacterium]|nr:nicotinate-nucleotide adenylyltransferase [Betaproteobacteria bacterium]